MCFLGGNSVVDQPMVSSSAVASILSERVVPEKCIVITRGGCEVPFVDIDECYRSKLTSRVNF